MLKSELFLENSLNYTIGNKWAIRVLLIVEYLFIFIESIDCVLQIFGVEIDGDDNAVGKANYLLLFYFINKSAECTVMVNGKFKICSLYATNTFLMTLAIYLLMYIVYKVKYEIIDNKVKAEKIELEQNSIKCRWVDYVLVNYFNIFLRLSSMYIFYLNFNVAISSILSSVDNAQKFWNFVFSFLSVLFLIFSVIIYCLTVNYSSLMFELEKGCSYNFDCLYSKKYDYVLISLKLLISLKNNFKLMNILSGLAIVVFNVTILGIIILFTVIVIVDVYEKKVVMVSNFNSNSMRFFLVTFNSVFVIFLLIFREEHKSLFITIVSLVSLAVFSIFLTKIVFRKIKKNILTNDKFLFFMIYLHYKTINEEPVFDIMNEFRIRHKIDCTFKDQMFEFYTESENRTFIECLVCKACKKGSTNLELLRTFKDQIRYTVKMNNNYLTKEETNYFILIKLLLKNIQDDRIELIYKTYKILDWCKIDNAFFRNLKLLNKLIILKGRSINSIKSFTEMKKINETSKKLEETIATLFDIYYSVGFCAHEIYSVAEKLNISKEEIHNNLSHLFSYAKIADSYSLNILKFVYENLYNIQEIFKGEKHFDEVEEFISLCYLENKLIEVTFDYAKKSLIIIRSSKQLIEFCGRKFDDLFPDEIKKEFVERFTNMILKTNSNSFEFECFIKRSPDDSFYNSTKLNCGITYSLNMTEFLIMINYSITNEDLIVVNEQMNNIVNFSENLGNFLFLNPKTIEKLNMVGYIVPLPEVFSSVEVYQKHSYNFNYKKYYNFYSQLMDTVTLQFPEVDNVMDNFIKFSSFISENKVYFLENTQILMKEKTSVKNYKIYLLYENKHMNDRSYMKTLTEEVLSAHGLNFKDNEGPNSASSIASFTKSDLGDNKRLKSQNMGKIIKEERNNTSKLKFLTNSIGGFIILMIIYCIFFMAIGILNNEKLNQSFNIKNKYDFIERNFYHSTSSILNNYLIYPQNSTDTEFITDKANQYFSQFSNNENITINIFQFINDELKAKLNFTQVKILDFEVYITSTVYQDTIQGYINNLNDYYFLSIVGDDLQLMSKRYTLLESMKVYLNNLRTICDRKIDWIYFNIITFKGSEADFSNIIDKKLSNVSKFAYELMMNYIVLHGKFLSLRNKIEAFHQNNLDEAFGQTTLLAFILMGTHLILILLSGLLLVHLNKSMKHNIFMTNEIIPKGENSKIMLKKLHALQNMNKFYFENPTKLASNIRKFRKDYRQQQLEEERRQMNMQNPYKTHQNLKEEDFVYFIDKWKQLRPVIYLLSFIFLLFYVYSFIFYFMLQSTMSNILLAAEFFKLCTTQFARIINTLNILEIEIFNNLTDVEAYNLIYEDYNNTEIGYLNNVNLMVMDNINKEQSYEKFSLLKPSLDKLGSLMDCHNVYYNLNDTYYVAFATKYRAQNPKINLEASLTYMCENFNVLEIGHNDLMEQRIIYKTYQLLQEYTNSYHNYDKMKKLFENNSFYDLNFIILLIVRPTGSYFKNKVLNVLELSTFTNFLMCSVVYLCLNIAIDILILIIFYYKIINQIKRVNDNLVNFIEIIKIF